MAKKRRVAVVIDLDIGFRHHFDVFAGIERYASEHVNWEIDLQPFIQSVQKAQGNSGHHGMIARATSELALRANRAGVPVVNVWSGSPAKALPGVIPDLHACGRMAAEHLLSRGFRRFAFQGYSKHRGTELALASFEAALKAANCACSTQFLPQGDQDARNWESYWKRTRRWIRGWKPPVGVFAIQDTIARHIANACRAEGLRIPGDVALIGLGNEPLITTHLKPTLSSIDVGFDRVGYRAAEMLDRLMNGKRPPSAPVCVAPTELVVRASTDVYMVDNPVVTKALRFIAERSHEDIDVKDVAKHVSVAIWSLRRYFHAALGRTIVQELARLRLERAKRLLLESEVPIKQLASECGFRDVKHFHKVFLKSEGESPGRYRRNRNNK